MRGATSRSASPERSIDISIHAPLAGRDDTPLFRFTVGSISIHAPLAGRDSTSNLPRATTPISIHAPLAGRDKTRGERTRTLGYFNPRAPCGARRLSASSGAKCEYFNPRAPCGARRIGRNMLEALVNISIHAPLAGRDQELLCQQRSQCNFNPRAPCGARHRWHRQFRGSGDFNPRAPCGARRPLPSCPDRRPHFNPRAPCGARLVRLSFFAMAGTISIHAPLAGRDRTRLCSIRSAAVFQSTRPLRGATVDMAKTPFRMDNFNPRAPCGARPLMPITPSKVTVFQSTRPLRGATRSAANHHPINLIISIHAPLAGRDLR